MTAPYMTTPFKPRANGATKAPAPPQAKGATKPGSVKAEAAKPSLKFKLFSEIETAPCKSYLVQGLFGEGEMSAIGGAPGTGKSALAGDASCHVAAGFDWFGRRVREQKAVLYVAAERARLTERRFAAWRKFYSVADLPLAVVSGVVNFLTNREHVDEIATYGKQLAENTGFRLGLIVIDTVSRALAGGDENGPKDMGAFVANASALQEITGAHVLLVHHVPQNEPTVRLRGHGSLLGAVDTLLTLEKGDTRIATVSKDNDGAEGDRFAFKFESVELGVDEEGFVTTAPVVVAQDAPSRFIPPSRKPKPKPLPAAVTVALKAFDKALAETGEAAPTSNHIPATAQVVTLDRWRSYAFQMNISDGEDRARRAAFSRALDRLAADGLISTWESYAWRIHRP